MELHGLTQVLECIEGHGLSISNLTTDQHKQAHQFDVWHVAKNIFKKLAKVCKKSALRY